ncbi:hypothetical protein AB5I41_05590 [Sphingomonas sp. MMS24-JH45]
MKGQRFEGEPGTVAEVMRRAAPDCCCWASARATMPPTSGPAGR